MRTVNHSAPTAVLADNGGEAGTRTRTRESASSSRASTTACSHRSTNAALTGKRN